MQMQMKVFEPMCSIYDAQLNRSLLIEDVRPLGVMGPRSALRQPGVARDGQSQFDNGGAIMDNGDPSTPVGEGNGVKAPRRPKRVRLLLDARTELTDEELKVSPFLDSKSLL